MKKMILVLCAVCVFGGCAIDPVSSVYIGIIKNDLILTRQAIIKHHRGIVFATKWIYAEKPGGDNTFQVLVKRVLPDSDAEKAGIVAGDEVLSVNGKEPWGDESIMDPFFASDKESSEENQPVTMKIKRGLYFYTFILHSL